ncbi:MAG: DUF6580 family putative transport protein [Verrucomicrobiota bacterium]
MSASRRPLLLLWLPLVFIAAALVFRWLKLTSPGMTLLPNFSPWMALAFTGTLVMSRALPWWVWPAAMMGINWAALGTASALAGESLAIYGMYAAVAFVASRLRGNLSVLQSLIGVTLCSVIFYGVTNTAAWMVEPGYAKTLAGWWQAQTTGLPAFAPSWIFLKNALLSDLAFSGLLLVAYNAESRVRSTAPMPWLARAAA